MREQEELYCNAGDRHYNLGEFDEALKNHIQYFKTVKKKGNETEKGRAYGRLGKDYLSLGKFQYALRCHDFQLNIARKMNDKAEEGRACENLGNTYHRKDDFPSANTWYRASSR